MEKNSDDNNMSDDFEDFKLNISANILHNRRQYIPDYESLDKLVSLLGDLSTIDYLEFLGIRKEAPKCLERFFLASVFHKFPKDKRFRIKVDDFLKYLHRTIDVEQVTCELLMYAASSSTIISVGGKYQMGPSKGYITEQEVERFVFDSVLRIPALKRRLHESFLPFYVFTVVRRMFFFLDPHRTRKVLIKTLAHSTDMDEFMWLQRMCGIEESSERDISKNNDILRNWYSPDNAIRLYKLYVDLDTDQNGMLSEIELMAYNGSSINTLRQKNRGSKKLPETVLLTHTAVHAIFQSNITYEPPEMDFRTFINFILAFEHRDTYASLLYMWRCLDFERTNRLTTLTIKHFYQDIKLVLNNNGYDTCPTSEDVCVEVLDMLCPPAAKERSGSEERITQSVEENLLEALTSNGGITFKQFVSSGQGFSVASMLLDANKFWQYDNRESLGNQSSSMTNEDSDGFYDDDDDDAAYSLPMGHSPLPVVTNEDEYDMY